MPRTANPLIQLSTSGQYFAAVLLVVFASQAVVMVLLPMVLAPDVGEDVEAFLAASILTVISGPVLWALMVGPIRSVASAEAVKHAAIFEQTRDGIMMLDLSGKILAANPAAESLVGQDEDGLVDKSITNVLPGFSPGGLANGDLADDLESCETDFCLESCVTRTDGSVVPAEICVGSLAIADEKRFTLIIRDISERRDAEAKLAAANSQLVDVAHRAGRAEIANCVLHNVGNVMTNVNVLVNSIAADVSRSRLVGLDRAVELLQNNQHRIAKFFEEDERGQLLPGYLAELAQYGQDERHRWLEDLHSLQENLHQVDNIVSAQQSQSRAPEVAAETDISELVARAMSVATASLKRHSIDYQLELADLPVAVVDHNKLLQVLVNLLTNAKEAVLASPDLHARICVRTYSPDEERFRIEVIDNGVGIEPAQLNDIFSQGFSSKVGSRGFGLHYSCLAVQEMEGCLTVLSDGPGTGATFTIDIPYRPASVEACT